MTSEFISSRSYEIEHVLRMLRVPRKLLIYDRPISGVIPLEFTHLNPVSVKPIDFANAVKIAVPQATDILPGPTQSIYDSSRPLNFNVTRDQAKSLADRLWDAGFKPSQADASSDAVKKLERRIEELETIRKDLNARDADQLQTISKLRDVVEVLMP